MSSNIEICNLALLRVGAATIQSLEDNTKSAMTCKTLLPFARDVVLRSHDWGFARKRQDLALLSSTFSGFDYTYQYPTDAVCLRKITNESGSSTSIVWDWNTQQYKKSGKVKYETCVSSDLNSTYIITNEELAEIVYTARVTNANLYDALFTEALAWKLASDLSMPLLNKPETQQASFKSFLYVLSQAQVSSSNEEEIEIDEGCSLLQSRL